MRNPVDHARFVVGQQHGPVRQRQAFGGTVYGVEEIHLDRIMDIPAPAVIADVIAIEDSLERYLGDERTWADRHCRGVATAAIAAPKPLRVTVYYSEITARTARPSTRPVSEASPLGMSSASTGQVCAFA